MIERGVRCPDEDCDCGGIRVECYVCHGEGGWDGYEDDPLWYEPGEWATCSNCGGSGRLTSCRVEVEDEEAAGDA